MASILSQSHHTGIETYKAPGFLFLEIAPNRTILELKLYKVVEAIIVDISQSHHTGIETKEMTVIEAAPIRLPIAPYWN